MYDPSIVHFAELAREKSEAAKANPLAFIVGAMLAGAYIGIAMILALTVGSGLDASIRPAVMGGVFGIGLILTVFAGAELFTGYAMYLSFGLARRTVRISEAIRTLLMVWIGNFLGALLLVALFYAASEALLSSGAIALNAYASHKVDADVITLLARGILCNWLVCLALWTATRVQGDAAKCIILGWVLMTFVACGFEHSVANMTALPLGLLTPTPTIHLLDAAKNLFFVTIGNVLGGMIAVAGAYLIAARTDTHATEAQHDTGPLPTQLRTSKQ